MRLLAGIMVKRSGGQEVGEFSPSHKTFAAKQECVSCGKAGGAKPCPVGVF